MSIENPDSQPTIRAPRYRRIRRWRRAAFLAPVLVAMCFVVAACGGGPTPAAGVASIGKSTATTDPPSGGSGNSGNGNNASHYADALKYAECMRSHGVANFPDPGANGSITLQGGPNSSNGINPSSAQFSNADKDCRHLLPNGGQMTPAQRQQAMAGLLKFSQCMRRHGFPNFPDPTTTGGGVGLHLTPSSGVDPRSPQFQSAQAACSSNLPGHVTRTGAPSNGSGFKSVVAG